MLVRSEPDALWCQQMPDDKKDGIAERSERSVNQFEKDAWTKWWWLRADHVRAWSADERRAFVVLLLTWIVTATPFSLVVWSVLLRLVSMSSVTSLTASLLVALAIGFPGLRGLASSIFPEIIASGDDAAAARLGGKVYLPTDERWVRGLWWLDPSAGVSDWSAEQVKVRQRIFGIGLFIFLSCFLSVASLLMACGMSERIAAIVSFVTTMPAALYAARQITKTNWPDLIRKADDDAVKLANKAVPPRT